MADAGRDFQRHSRLRKRRQFLEVYESGQKAHTATLVVYVRENGLSCHRLGLTVSRKIGKAVTRNRIKRRLRELFRARREAIPGSLDIVVNVKRPASQATFQELGRDLDRSLSKVLELEQWQLD